MNYYQMLVFGGREFSLAYEGIKWPKQICSSEALYMFNLRSSVFLEMKHINCFDEEKEYTHLKIKITFFKLRFYLLYNR